MAHLRWRWWFWHPYSDWNVKRRGKKDGRLTPPVPPWKSDRQPPFIMQLKQAGDNDARILGTTWSQLDRTLKTEWLQAENAILHRDEEVAAAQKAYDAARKSYEAVHKTEPPVDGDRRRISYSILIVLLFLFEFPMNAIVFRLFGENEMFTVVATGAIALSLLASAHYLGELLQERSVGGKKNTLGIISLIAIPAFVIGGVAYLREQYLKGVGEALGGLDPTVMWLAFVGFNLLIFLVAAMASYRVHNDSLAAVHRAKKKLMKAQAGYEQASKNLERVRIEREKQFDTFNTRANLVKDTVQRLCDAYRTTNLECRSDRGEIEDSYFPRSFDEYPEVTIPPNLATLEWESRARHVRNLPSRAEVSQEGKVATSSATASNSAGTT
jgi:hypothetical protein